MGNAAIHVMRNDHEQHPCHDEVLQVALLAFLIFIALIVKLRDLGKSFSKTTGRN